MFSDILQENENNKKHDFRLLIFSKTKMYVVCMFDGCLKGFTAIKKCSTSQKKVGDNC